MIFDEMAKSHLEQLKENEAMKHPANQSIMQWFHVGDHLPEGLPRRVIVTLKLAAEQLNRDVPDGPEKTAGLRKLLEAKDCMIRASMPFERRSGPVD